jgi:hypothetical protein
MYYVVARPGRRNQRADEIRELLQQRYRTAAEDVGFGGECFQHSNHLIVATNWNDDTRPEVYAVAQVGIHA